MTQPQAYDNEKKDEKLKWNPVIQEPFDHLDTFSLPRGIIYRSTQYDEEGHSKSESMVFVPKEGN
jgi:hypothetical protein